MQRLEEKNEEVKEKLENEIEKHGKTKKEIAPMEVMLNKFAAD